MAKTRNRSEMGRKISRFCDFLGRRFRAASLNSRRSQENSRQGPFSTPVRFVFVLAAAPVLLLFAGLLAYAHYGDSSPGALDHLMHSSSVTAHLQYLLLQHQATVEFISFAVVIIQIMAIAGAIANWPTVLFAYVVITGLLGTVVGVVGIFGIVFSILFSGNGNSGGRGGTSPPDHSTLFTVLLVVAFILLFYLLTVLGLKLMAYMRRRRDRFEDAEEFGAGRGVHRSKRPYRHSPVARRGAGGHKRSSYKSIDTISSPFNNGEGGVEVNMGGIGEEEKEEEEEEEEDVFDEEDEGDDDDDEGNEKRVDSGVDNSELSHVYVDSGVPSLSTLLPPTSQKSTRNPPQSSHSQRPTNSGGSASSFAFSI